mgnify:CR=1 FL=1
MKLFVGILMLSVFGITFSLNAVEQPIEVECPLGGSNAKGWEILGSAIYGVLLDGRVHGAHVGPLPPPECPDNGFLVYKESFSENELIHLREYIFSEEYQSMWKNKAPAFYRLAKIYEYEGRRIIDHYYHYVIATWKFDYPPFGKKYSFYALEAIEALKKTIDTTQSDLLSERQIVEVHYLLAELYRRVEDFENARKELHWVKQTDNNKDYIHPDFIAYLDSLILHKDSDPHLISDYSTLPELTIKEAKMVSVIKKRITNTIVSKVKENKQVANPAVIESWVNVQIEEWMQEPEFKNKLHKIKSRRDKQFKLISKGTEKFIN